MNRSGSSPVRFRSTSFERSRCYTPNAPQGKTLQEAAMSARVFRFGVFEVDAATGELRFC